MKFCSGIPLKSVKVLIGLCLISLTLLVGSHSEKNGLAFEDPTKVEFLPDQQPEYLTYEELVYLSDHPHPQGTLKLKVDKLFRTPAISNQASRDGVQPKYPYDPQLGHFLRVMSWNIEKSMKLPEAIIAFTNAKQFALLIDTDRFPEGSPKYEEVLTQRSFLDDVDILLLQEMDIGMKRSGYRDSPKELAEILHMNYAYAPAYLEIDKVNLGIQRFQNENGTFNKDMEKMIEVDPKRYKGLF